MGYVPSSEALPWPCCGSCVPPQGSAAAPGPPGPLPPPPNEGAGSRTGPPKGIAPSCSCSPPPPLAPANTVDPLPSPWNAPRDGDRSSATHPCAPCMTCMLGPCARRTGFAWRRGCPTLLPPTRCTRRCKGEEGIGPPRVGRPLAFRRDSPPSRSGPKAPRGGGGGGGGGGLEGEVQGGAMGGGSGRGDGGGGREGGLGGGSRWGNLG